MKKFVYVTEMGYLFRMTQRAYKEFLQARVAGNFDLACELLGPSLGYVTSVTDMSKEDAQELLEEIS